MYFAPTFFANGLFGDGLFAGMARAAQTAGYFDLDYANWKHRRLLEEEALRKDEIALLEAAKATVAAEIEKIEALPYPSRNKLAAGLVRIQALETREAVIRQEIIDTVDRELEAMMRDDEEILILMMAL